MTLRAQFASGPIADCLDDDALLRSMVAFERALARAQGAAGAIPAHAAERIDSLAAGARFDTAELVTQARRAGTLAIAFVKQLTAQVRNADVEASGYVHWGATSQDVLDTAMVLCARDALRLVLERVDRLGEAVARLADEHRATPMVARTLLQPATPIPFGFKAATWLDALARSRLGLQRAAAGSLVLQFGGASGVLSPLRERGVDVAQRLARELGLPEPAMPWHSIRDRVARLGAELGIACGVVAKIGLDVALLMQPELGEAFEPSGKGRGGSSALPHKQNPLGAMYAREAGLRAPGLVANLVLGVAGEHERGLGQWQTQFWTLGELFAALGSALDAMVEVVEGLRIERDAMARNLEALHGFVFAEALGTRLAVVLGKSEAHARVEALCRKALAEGSTLQRALEADDEMAALVPAQEREQLFDAAAQFGAADTMIDRALAAWRDEEDDRCRS